MKALEGIKKVFDKILEILGTITLGIMTILVVYQVVTRYVFNAPSAFSEALAQYLFVWMIMFGSAYVYGSKEHLTGYDYTMSQVKRIDPSLHISMATLYFSVPFTGVITLYYAIYNIVRTVQDYKEGKRKLSDPLGGTA